MALDRREDDMAGGKMPRPDEAAKEFFRSIVPDHPAVRVRPMFGQLAEGGGPFEPMAGRPMREYVVLPPAWREDEPHRVREWVARSLDHAEELPPKQPKKKPS
jgi:hypothetical protein